MQFLLLLGLIVSASAMTTAERLGFNSTALDEYVAKPDDTYSWTDTGHRLNGTVHTDRHPVRGIHWTGYVLNMTSQKWLTEADSSRHIWWHTLVVIVPDNLDKNRTDWSTMWITDGTNEDKLPDHHEYNILIAARLAVNTQVVTSALYQVPNAHITFPSDPKQQRRSEDAIVAYTWRHFLDHPDQPEWIIFLPMVKAAVRALDTVEAFLVKGAAEGSLGIYEDIPTPVKQWTVMGASKRGWTTWLVGAVIPDRVQVLIPVVLDMLNFQSNIHHMWRNYGGWTWAMQDYVAENVTTDIDTPNMKALCDIQDPYVYLERLTMPKMVCNSGMDEFFMPDDTHWWWKDLPAPKHFLMSPNTDHICITGVGDILPAVGAFIKSVMNETPAPVFDWKIDTEGNGDITVDVGNTNPKTVTMWHATTCNAKRRDFRAANLDNPCTCGVAVKGKCVNIEALWYKYELTEEVGKPGIYVAHQEVPAVGWTAFFVDVQYGEAKREGEPTIAQNMNKLIAASDEVTWPINWPEKLEFTSEVSIIPNTFPFEDCHGEKCLPILV